MMTTVNMAMILFLMTVVTMKNNVEVHETKYFLLLSP